MPTWKTIGIVLAAFAALSIAVGVVIVILWSSGGGRPERGPVATVRQHQPG